MVLATYPTHPELGKFIETTKQIAKEVAARKLPIDQITDEIISSHLLHTYARSRPVNKELEENCAKAIFCGKVYSRTLFCRYIPGLIFREENLGKAICEYKKRKPLRGKTRNKL